MLWGRGTSEVCNGCEFRFRCWTGRPACAAPYSDDTLRRWRQEFPALTDLINEELADRQIERETSGKSYSKA